METSPPEKQTVRVTILSRPYKLRTAGDPSEVETLAASVNELMLSIAGKVPDSDSTGIAVMACLQLADRVRDLEKQLSSVDQIRQSLDEKTARVSGLLDQLIASADASR